MIRINPYISISYSLACSKYPTFMPTRRTAATRRQQRHTRVDEFDTARIDKRSSGKTLRLTAPIARSRSRPTAPSVLSQWFVTYVREVV